MIIGEKDNIKSEAGVATEHSEGLVVKFMFNAVTIDQNLVSHFTADKKVNDFTLYLNYSYCIIFLPFIDYVYWSCSH